MGVGTALGTWVPVGHLVLGNVFQNVMLGSPSIKCCESMGWAVAIWWRFLGSLQGCWPRISAWSFASILAAIFAERGAEPCWYFISGWVWFLN